MNNLIKLRKFLKLSQKDISNIIEVERNTYSDYERKKLEFPIEKLNIIANRYELSLDYLLDLTNDYTSAVKEKNIEREEIGKILKHLREEHLLNQLELARLLDTHQSKISNYEKGKSLDFKVLKRYATFFSKTIDYLCGKVDK